MKLPLWISARLLIVLGAMLAGVFAWWLLDSLSDGRRAGVKARLEAGRGEAALESGADAADSIGEFGDRSIQTRGKARHAQDKIDAAPDAAAGDAAARGGLCDADPDYC